VVSEAVQVVPLSSRRAVALVGASADLKAVKGLIASLDSDPPAAEQYVSIIALKQNDAGDVTESLRQMLDVGDGGGGAYAAPAEALTEQVRRLSVARHGLGKEDLTLDLSVPIRLIPDEATNSIMIASTQANVTALKEVITGMDTLPIGDAVVVRIFPLDNADAGRSKRVIDELFERGEQLRRLPGTDRQGLPTTTTGVALAGEIAVSVDERTNSLIVAGREEAVAFVEVLIGQLDSDEAANWVETRVLTLEHADAVDLAETLRTVIVQGRTDLPGAAGIQRQIARLRVKKDAQSPGVEADVFAPLTDVIIVPEEQLNALIVVASPANLQAVAELTSMLDIELAAADNTVRVYPLAFAAADRVANLIDQFFQRRQRTGAMRAEDEVIIAPDLRTNSLFISTSPRSFSLIESLLKTLDGEERDYTVGIHVVPVPNADVQQLAPKIQEAMRQRIEAGRRAGEVASPTDTFNVSADAANDLLIVTSSEENLAVVKDLINAISAQTAPDIESAQGFEIIPVKSQSPQEIAQYIDEIYVRKEIEKRGEGAMSVQPNDRLGALIVTGSEYDIAQVRRLVQQLDTAEVVQQRVVRRFELRSADALQLVNLIEQVMAGPPVARNARNDAAFKVKYNEAEMELDVATRAQISVTPELGTNSIFVQAPPEAMAFIEEIINSVETSDNVRRTIETFHLVNADARQMAQLLSALLNLQQQGDRLILIPSRVEEETEDPEGLIPGIGRTQLTAVPDERQELSITIDARTNTLLVSGTEEYLSLVRDIVQELDSFEANERSTLVYELQNAKAEEIEQRLQALYRAESEARQRTLDPAEAGSSSSVFEREVTVVGDIASNKIIVQTSPRYIQTVEDLIRELDARPPQVDIQVLLAEVTLNDQSTWGVDFNVEFGGDDYMFGSLIGAGPLSALGVPNLELSSTDFQIMVTALEQQGRLEILSKPNVTVNNNQPARINVGENIAIATGVQFFAQGNSSAIIERRDVGIIMDVTPSISSDGYVRLEIAPSISQVSSVSDQLAENVSSPRINTREVSTTVTVRDGQTIVIGGLIQTTESDRRTKVPILGDIPGIGEIFKGYDVESVKTELLVILTPTIIPGEGEEHNERVSRILTQEIMQRSNPDTLVDVVQSMDRSRPLRREVDPNAPQGPAGNPPPSQDGASGRDESGEEQSDEAGGKTKGAEAPASETPTEQPTEQPTGQSTGQSTGQTAELPVTAGTSSGSGDK
jgi:type II secretion system protein D